MLSIVVLTLLISLNCETGEGEPDWHRCLPQNVKLTDVVTVEGVKKGAAVRRRTVADQMKESKARCRKGKLIDGRGKQIYFYRLTGCWGYAPANYLEILERQRNELRELRKRYSVFEIPCNPYGPPIP